MYLFVFGATNNTLYTSHRIHSQHSRTLSLETGIALVVVEGGTHGLGQFTATGGLARVVKEVAAGLEEEKEEEEEGEEGS